MNKKLACLILIFFCISCTSNNNNYKDYNEALESTINSEALNKENIKGFIQYEESRIYIYDDGDSFNASIKPIIITKNNKNRVIADTTASINLSLDNGISVEKEINLNGNTITLQCVIKKYIKENTNYTLNVNDKKYICQLNE